MITLSFTLRLGFPSFSGVGTAAMKRKEEEEEEKKKILKNHKQLHTGNCHINATKQKTFRTSALPLCALLSFLPR